jgi:hypothetical protein
MGQVSHYGRNTHNALGNRPRHSCYVSIKYSIMSMSNRMVHLQKLSCRSSSNNGELEDVSAHIYLEAYPHGLVERCLLLSIERDIYHYLVHTLFQGFYKGS